MSSPRISNFPPAVSRQGGTKQQNGPPNRTMIRQGSPLIPYQFPIKHQNGSMVNGAGVDVPDTTPGSTKRTFITGNRFGRVEVSAVSRKTSSPSGPTWEAEPKFSRLLLDTEVDEGDIVCFHAQFACHPRAEVQWLKNTQEVVTTDWCLIYTNQSESMLVICNVNESDTAEYRVTVTNPAGRISSSAKLLVYIKEERWIRLQDKAKLRTKDLEGAINSLTDFEQAYNRLKTWLGEKDKMTAVLGPIGIEPGILRNQKQQVEVLQDEFAAHEGQLDHIKEAGQAILEKQDPRTRQSSPVQQQIGEIQHLWDEVKKRLDGREGQVDDVLRESEKFHDTLADNSDWLIEFGNKISALAPISGNPDVVRQQMEETKTLQREADRKKPAVESMTDVHRALTTLNPETTAKAEVTLKLESVKTPYTELCRKLDERQGKLQAALLQSKDFEDSYTSMLQWLDAKDRELTSSKPISAKPDVLRRQLVEHEEIPKEIVKQVYTYERMIEKMDGLIDEAPPGPEKSALQRKRDALASKWAGVNDKSTQRQERLRDCSGKAKQYTDELNQFLPWLRSAEDRLASLGPVTMKPNVVKRQYEVVKQLRDDIENHRDHHKAVNQTCSELVNKTDVDHPYVKDQVSEVNGRWEKLQRDVNNQLRVLEDLTDRLGSFHENVNQSQSSLANIEEKLASHDAIGTKDPRNLEKLQMLQDEMDNIEKTIVVVKDHSNDLMAAAPSQADTGQIVDEVDGVDRRYNRLKAMVGERRNQLEAGNQEVRAFQSLLNDVGSRLTKSEEKLENFSPVGRDTPTVNAQIEETQKFHDDLDDIKKALLGADKNFRDIIDRGYMTDPDGFRDQLDNLNKRWARIRERTNNRQADLEKTASRLKTLQQIIQDVDDSLEKAEAQQRSQRPVGADVEMVKQQMKEFRTYIRNYVDPLVTRIREANRVGQSLIQSAAPRVNTTKLESDLEAMNDRWNKLKTANSDREAKLNEGLLRCGKFQEALNSLMSWIGETEELVTHQKDPSSDYKVVKAQLSEQLLLDRLITDREPSVDALKEMGEQLSRVSEPQDRSRIQQQLTDLERRWRALVDSVRDRRKKLEQTEKTAKGFHEQIDPLVEWLDKTERSLAQQEPVSTEKAQIQRQIQEQQTLADEVQSQAPKVEEAKRKGEELFDICVPVEQEVVRTRLDNLESRFQALEDKTANKQGKLSRALASNQVFGEGEASLLRWLTDTERKLAKVEPISIYPEQTQGQLKEHRQLDENIQGRRPDINKVLRDGQELLKQCTGKEIIDVQQKLDSIQNRYEDVCTKSEDRLNQLQQAVPLTQEFNQLQSNVDKWLTQAEQDLRRFDSSASPEQQKAVQEKLQREIDEHRPSIDALNNKGDKLIVISPGQGAAEIRQQCSDANTRFNELCAQTKDIEYRLISKLEGAQKVEQNMDNLLAWINDTERTLNNSARETVGVDPDGVREQLKKAKVLDREINSKMSRVQDVSGAAEILLQQTADPAQRRRLDDRLKQLKQKYDTLSNASADRVEVLEEALPLALSFNETHDDLANWLTDIESELKSLRPPGLDAEEIKKEVDKNRLMSQAVNEKQQYVNKLNKIAPELSKISPGPGARSLDAKVESDNSRYDNVKQDVDKRGEKLYDLLQRTSSFIEDLDSTLEQLNITAEKLSRPESISSDPEVLRKQRKKLQLLQDQVDSQMDAVDNMRKAGQDMISAASADDPYVREMRDKLDQLSNKWQTIVRTANQRASNLMEAMNAAEGFWVELNSTNATIKDIQDHINTQEPPAVEEKAVKDQQDVLQAIKEDVDAVNQDLENTRQSGKELMRLVGEADKPEVQKNLDDMNRNWEALNAAYRNRDENLRNATDLSKAFEDGLKKMDEYMTEAEDKLEAMQAVGADPQTIKNQLDDLKKFKQDQDRQSPTLDRTNQLGNKLLAQCTFENREALQGPLSDMNRRWKALTERSFDRQHKLEAGMLALGQLDSTLDELIGWMDRADQAMQDQKPIMGDPRQAEIELAKHKVLQNDIMSHQSSVDSVNQAGRTFVTTADNRQLAGVIKIKLDDLNVKWRNLMKKSEDRQRELEGSLGESKLFGDEANRLLHYLKDLDSQLSSAQPVGGLPETAREQLEKHSDLMKQMAREQMNYDRLMDTGRRLRSKAGPEADREGGVGHTLSQLQNNWENAKQKATERQTKLEDALKQAQQFHDALQSFITWLTTAEKTMNAAKPPSTILETVNQQIAEHKDFLRDIAAKRDTMKDLDRTGTQLKYFSQKQDVTLIKNLLISVQNRWDRVQNRCNERSRQLDSGFKRSKQFADQYKKMFDWLDEAENKLDLDKSIGSDPETLKAQLRKHKELQRSLGSKQPTYDGTLRAGRSLREKSNPADTKIINGMLTDLKDKWDTVCGKSVDRQRKLEESLLHSGQFKDALQALLDWLYEVEPKLNENNLVHGDIDTVMNLMEAHKSFQRDLGSRKSSVRSVNKSAKDLMEKSSEDTSHLKSKVQELGIKWDNVCQLSLVKQDRLEDAMKEAEEFHEAVHMLLEWLADAEQTLKFQGPLSEDKEIIQDLLEAHRDFKLRIDTHEGRLNEACQLGEAILAKCHPDAVTVIKHWITVLQARWEEVMNWYQERQDKLEDALTNLQENAELLEKLLKWLEQSENTLQERDTRPTPDDIDRINKLLEEHQAFEDDMATRQSEVDRLTKSHKRRRSTDIGPAGIPMLDRSRRGKGSRPMSREPSPGPDASRNPRVAALHNKWKQVWLMAMERRRRLQDALDRQAELKKLKNFNFDDWRQRYVRWMSHKKARVMDFFRKLDLDRDGKLTRKEFSDGIINSKFPTNQLEMNAVVDIFDRDGDGYVDYKEFIAALWPERESGQSQSHPATDAQKIEDEVKRQCNLCTCSKKFKVQRIAETKYRFGESQQMRLVRILRSTVMVRVGGGWLALDEFLVKNDPCRAKGRTNVELREQFILAEGVTQGLTPFQSSRSRRSRSPSESSTGSAGSRSLSGPLIKIKEKRKVTRPWQEGSSLSPRSTTRTSAYSSSSGVKNGDPTIRKSTTRDTHSAPGMGTGRPGASGYSTSTNVLGTYSTVDVQTKPRGSSMRGEVTVRTVRDEERTVTRPASSASSVYARLSKPTSKTTTTTSTTKTSPKPKTGAWR